MWQLIIRKKLIITGKDLALSVIGGRWKIAIIWCLLQQSPLRLSELQKKLPDVNQRMLIRQLRELEEDEPHYESCISRCTS